MEGEGVLGLFIRIILFFLILGLLLWGTSEYTLSISDAVLSILTNIQYKEFTQEWPNFLFLILMLAIPFLLFYLLYHLFMKSIMKYSRFIETKTKTKTKGYIQSIKETGIYHDQQPEVNIVVDAFDEKKQPFTVEIKQNIDSMKKNPYKKGSLISILYNPKNPHDAVIDQSQNEIQ